FRPLPDVTPHQSWIQPQFFSRHEHEIASQPMPDRVHRLIERMLCPRARAFPPEVGLDPIARETLPTAQAEDRKQTQWPLLLRGYGDRMSLVPQGKRSQEIEN